MKIAICGAGTVGTGVAQILHDNADLISLRGGEDIEIAVVASRRRPLDGPLQGYEFTSDLSSVCERSDVDVIVELMGGTTDAKRLIEQALKAGKSVVTANKALIAEHGDALFDLAAEHKVSLKFEAAVAGSIPIIKVLRESLAGARIDWIAGIINGTANFILTEMASEGVSRSFEAVLAEAQSLGYAEADPTFDIDGTDAAHKLTILGALAFNQPLRFDQVHIEGITEIEPSDFKFARAFGYRIKHLGVARLLGASLEMAVYPCFVATSAILSGIDGVLNGVLVSSDAAGETFCSGAGAGAGPTGNAVVADLIDLHRQVLGPGSDALTRNDQPLKVLRPEETQSGFYLRITVEDRPGVMSAITTVLADFGISLDKILQEDAANHCATVALVTDPILQGVVEQAVAELEQHDAVLGKIQKIRVF